MFFFLNLITDKIDEFENADAMVSYCSLVDYHDDYSSNMAL